MPSDETVTVDTKPDGGLADSPYEIATLPAYLRQLINDLADPRRQRSDSLSRLQSEEGEGRIKAVPLKDIASLSDRPWQYFHLLLLRHHLTVTRISGVMASHGGIAPELLLERARVHEALAYPELALGDALAAFTICEYAESGDGDIEPIWLHELEDSAEPLEGDERESTQVRIMAETQYACASVILRCLKHLNADDHSVELWESTLEILVEQNGEDVALATGEDDDWCLFSVNELNAPLDPERSGAFYTGASRREVYPWNNFEGDRMSDDALQEINDKLKTASEGMVEVRKSLLPTLTADDATGLAQSAANLNIKVDTVTKPGTDSISVSTNAQLGLFAVSDLPPGSTVLTERSALTAIRPHGASLCDACAGDLEFSESQQACAGCGIPFCSPECLSIATSTYHAPNLDDVSTDEGFPPPSSPFCPGSDGEADISNLGRAESSSSAEWDLYFLLVVRALQMAETIDCHPLEIWECKYLWGDFNQGVSLQQLTAASKCSSSPALKRTLPFSLRHHIELPLQWFELLMLSRSESTPYSRKWLQRYDWWVIQTLYAKFRGVADAKLSSWSGEPETASVYPLWCLANHSCDSSVTWEGGGFRLLKVREEPVLETEEKEWEGVKRGEEVWNHYTDVREKNYRVRRSRLREVLGGDCQCSRCLREEAESRADEV